MRQWIRSAFVQIMAFRQSNSVPSPYLNQWWVIVNWTLGKKFHWNFNQNTKFYWQNAYENIVCEMVAILSRGDDLLWLSNRPWLVGVIQLTIHLSIHFGVALLALRPSYNRDCEVTPGKWKSGEPALPPPPPPPKKKKKTTNKTNKKQTNKKTTTQQKKKKKNPPRFLCLTSC